MPKRISLAILLIIALAVGFAGGFYFKDLRASSLSTVNAPVVSKDTGQPQGVDFSIFWNAWDLIHSQYVNKSNLDTQSLVYGAIDGMVKSIGDPYTVFFPPKESTAFAQQIHGAFDGIGIEIGLRNSVITVIAPIKNTPAARAGILSGDQLIKIDGKPTDGITLDAAVNQIRGQKGTKVTLTISRSGQSGLKDILITRDVIKIPAVDWKLLDDNTAYVQVFIFNENVDSEFKKAAQEVTQSKANRIILDLRDNPGGLLDSAVDLAGYFLDAGKIVTIERFGDGTENQYKTQPNGLLKNYPVVVLLNKGSASASEILAGALKDNRGVLVVGETSYGKGSVQEVEDLPMKASLKITIAKWFTPSGASIDQNGIKPDIEVKLTEEDAKANKDPQLDKARSLIKNLR